jgi:tetratricopeptide (TPR) repeat protein
MENYVEELTDSNSIQGHRESTLQMYTPAMMAQMLDIPVRAIRLWSRAGLIQPTTVVMKVPYFNYSVLALANRFAQWMHQGLTAHSLVKQLSDLARLRGDDLREAATLPLTLEGRRLVLSYGALRLEASGQMQLCFEQSSELEEYEPITLKFAPLDVVSAEASPSNRLLAMLDAAVQAEDAEDLEAATRWYHAVLSEFGPNAEVCFQLAEVLYRQADLGAARERYMMALELEPGLVEARANLGCVLAEYGQNELAVDVFQVALKQYPDYADVHFHLARLLDMQGQPDAAIAHWQRFIELAPASPWSEEALARLSEHSSLLEY